MTSRVFTFILLVFLAAGLVSAQEVAEAPLAESAGELPALPREFRGLSLGMSLESLKEALSLDPLFTFQESDVSFLPQTEQTLVDSGALGYLSRAFFQLEGGSLFIMAFSMNTARLDHHAVYTAFVNKYGQPESLSPREAVWDNGETRVSIERPLTVKYIDRRLFDAVLAEAKAADDAEILRRGEFLEQF